MEMGGEIFTNLQLGARAPCYSVPRNRDKANVVFGSRITSPLLAFYS